MVRLRHALLRQACAPSSVHETFPRREQALVSDEPDHNGEQHEADNLIHGTELAAVMKEMAEAKAGQDGDVNFKFPLP
jgi:hypothetical protein